jgi:hypothetical protein
MLIFSKCLSGNVRLIFGLMLLVCAQSYASLDSVRAQTSHDPHHHARLGDSMLNDISPDVSITEAAAESSWKRENLIVNQDKTYAAFTVCQPLDKAADSGCQEHLYFEEKRTGKVFEVSGLPMPHRPFSDLAWADRRTLVFDRWSQPHYGIHYAVDVEAKKLVAARSFEDRSSD